MADLRSSLFPYISHIYTSKGTFTSLSGISLLFSSVFQSVLEHVGSAGQSPPMSDFGGLFNGTSRPILVISAAFTVFLAGALILIDPNLLDIDALSFRFCEPDACNLHRVVYSFTFGLIVTWFILGLILIAFPQLNSFRASPGFFVGIVVAQVLLQFIGTIGASYMGDIVYRIGYWMWSSTIKLSFSFTYSLLITVREFHYRCMNSGKQMHVLIGIVILALCSVVLILLNGIWFYNPTCSRWNDLFFVGTTAANVLTFCASFFEPALSSPLVPLTITFTSQLVLFHMFHLTPDLLACSRSPLMADNLQWIHFACLILWWCVIAFVVLRKSTSAPRLPLYTRMDAAKLAYDAAGHQGINQNASAPTAVGATMTDPLLRPGDHASRSDSSLSETEPLNLRSQLLEAETNKVESIAEHDEFVDTVFFSTKRCNQHATSYFFAIFVFSALCIMLTHFGIHTDYIDIGMPSNFISMYLVPSIVAIHILYFAHVFALNFLPQRRVL